MNSSPNSPFTRRPCTNKQNQITGNKKNEQNVQNEYLSSHIATEINICVQGISNPETGTGDIEECSPLSEIANELNTIELSMAFDALDLVDIIIDICIQSTILTDLAQGNLGVTVTLKHILRKLDTIDKKLTQLMGNKLEAATRHVKYAVIFIESKDMSKAIHHLTKSYDLGIEAMGLTENSAEAANCSNLNLLNMFLLESFDERKDQFVLYKNLEERKKKTIAELIKLIFDELFKKLIKFRKTSISFSGLQVVCP
jgi:hypothetical protein